MDEEGYSSHTLPHDCIVWQTKLFNQYLSFFYFYLPRDAIVRQRAAFISSLPVSFLEEISQFLPYPMNQLFANSHSSA
ncbi:MAG: hypothetical protein QM800_15850 [Paludibacter sp.]